MPEMLEVEAYRRLAATTLGRTIVRVDAPDAWFLKGVTADQLHDVLEGRRFVADRRIGKLLLLDVDGGPTLGLRFGMTGRLVVDGRAGVEALEYSSDRDDPQWDRFALGLCRRRRAAAERSSSPGGRRARSPRPTASGLMRWRSRRHACGPCWPAARRRSRPG